MWLNVGDRVLVDKCKGATLRYCGTVEFAAGVWKVKNLTAREERTVSESELIGSLAVLR